MPRDPERLAALIVEANARGYRLDALCLNSPGGLVWETMAMAVMVRWVENLATAVYKNAKCESACFGLFAAGYRKYVEPAADPTQIGVHSVFELIRQQQGQMTSKEAEKVTIWAVRRLKEVGVPDSVIGKIVTTPPKYMAYLTIADLQAMGVDVIGHPGPPTVPPPERTFDPVMLAPAVVKADVVLDNGATVPAGTIVVTELFGPQSNPMCCHVTYHLPGQDISSTRLPEASLMLISQGWNSSSPPKSSEPSAPKGLPPQAAVPTPDSKRPFRVAADSDEGGFLTIRNGPGPQYNMIAKMPHGATVLVGRCIPLDGGWKPFCEVEWQGITGWASSCCIVDLQAGFRAAAHRTQITDRVRGLIQN